MSFDGKNPSKDWLNLIPQSVDPASPDEGDLFYSDGTPRDEGLWIYQNGLWEQISTSGNLSVLASLTLTPQSSDPGSPAEGMVFMSNGTPRAEGLWLYVNGAWSQITGLKQQEFTLKEPFEVRLATTANVVIANQLENGDTIDGVVLVTGDFVLVKSQTTASENGVYVVPASGAATRHVNFDTFSELNGAIVYVGFGTTNMNLFFYQNATLASLSDPQTWATSPNANTHSFTVPEDVYELAVEAVAGGGAGGGSFRNNTSGGCGCGGGGGGAIPIFFRQTVTPSQVINMSVAVSGLPVRSRNPNANGTASDGGAGGNTTIVFSDRTIILNGADGGMGGVATTSTGAGGAGGSGTGFVNELYTSGGDGGTNSGASVPGAGGSDIYAAGGSIGAGTSGRGGAGGAGRLNGANGSVTGTDAPVATAASGAGGGGGALKTGAERSARSGWGGSGYVRFSWE